jgi:hypothetical protein
MGVSAGPPDPTAAGGDIRARVLGFWASVGIACEDGAVVWPCGRGDPVAGRCGRRVDTSLWAVTRHRVARSRARGRASGCQW